MSAEGVKTKVCSDCKKRLPLERFDKLAKGKHGRRPQCKPCTKARREETGATAASYARALRRLRDAYPQDFAAALAEERGHHWEPSFAPESADYWRGRWADTASKLTDVLGALDDAAGVLEAEGLTRCAKRARDALAAAGLSVSASRLTERKDP